MTKLRQLYTEQGQSPWLDNLTRGHLHRGELHRLVAAGIRGVTSNPTIFARAISGSADYDAQFHDLTRGGASVESAYWTMVIDDINEALYQLRPIYDHSRGGDGFVSVGLAPDLARDTGHSVDAARALHERINEPNLFVKIPATPLGVPAVRELIGEGHSINITLLFSLERYEEIIEAYLAGLEVCEKDLAQVHSVASFVVSRVDTEVDRRLEAIGTDEALALRRRAALAQAKLAYQLFTRRFQGPRWEALADRGARLQRPLWASTSTKNPAYADTLYVDGLIGPDTINTPARGHHRRVRGPRDGGPHYRVSHRGCPAHPRPPGRDRSEHVRRRPNPRRPRRRIVHQELRRPAHNAQGEVRRTRRAMTALMIAMIGVGRPGARIAPERLSLA